MGALSMVNVFVRGSTRTGRSPIADFTSNVITGTVPLTVNFLDWSLNEPTEWEWDFTNDGTTDSTEQNPTHTYTTAGSYTVRLTARNSSGSNTIIKTAYITAEPAETYTLTRSVSTVNEGNSFTITLNTGSVEPGTAIPYTITGISSADINNTDLTGEFIITGTKASGTANRSFTVSADYLTEGAETFTLALNNGYASISVVFNDTTTNPTYTLTRSATNINEGRSVTISLATYGVAPGTNIPYTISGITSDDIDGASLIGNFVIAGTVTSGTASITLTATNDLQVEGPETFTVSLDNGEAAIGILINDTSAATPIVSINATGGTVSTTETASGTYKVHTFTESGTFSVIDANAETSINLFIVGGGGSGGYDAGGGGGGGGVVSMREYSIGVGTYSVVVGSGGASSGTGTGNNGQNSSFADIIAYGGGGGGKKSTTGGIGGSGGGGGHPGALGGAGTEGQGFNGGQGSSSRGGGGGGSYTAGENSGTGGTGTNITIPGVDTSVLFGSGGGGGTWGSSVASTTGLGGPNGGRGGTNNAFPTSGVANTGQGGGGGGNADVPSRAYGAAGGSGIVYISYLPVEISPPPPPPMSDTYSVYFDGVSDYISVPTTSTAMHQLGNWTYECWIYFNALPTTGYQNIFGQGASGQNTFGLYSANSSANNWSAPHRFKVNQANLGDRIVGTTTISTSTWYHVAVVRNSGVITLYVNGVAEGTYSNSTNYTFNNNPLLIGNSSNCYISNFRFVQGTAVYTANFTPSTTPLVAIDGTSLLTCQNSTIIDNSTNNFTISTNGDAVVTMYDPFGNNGNYWSGYFDGNGDYLRLQNNSVFAVGTIFTMECWFYPTTSQSGALMMGTVGTPAPQLGWQNSTTFGLASVGIAWRLTSSVLPTLKMWNHVAVVRVGLGTNETKLFLNGSIIAIGTVTDTWTTTTGFTIGAASDNTAGFTGYISNARIVKGTALYTSNFIPSSTPLTNVSGTSLLTLQDMEIVDNSSNNFAITAYGNTTMLPTSAITYDDGYYSNYFDGNGDYLRVAYNAALDITQTDFTIEFWVNPNGIGTSQQIAVQRPASGTSGWNIRLETSGRITFWYTGGSTFQSAVLTGNTWSHIAISRSGNMLTIHVNGVSSTVGFITNGVSVANTVNMYIGVNELVTSGYFLGHLSNFRIVNGSALYSSNFTPSTTPLTNVSGTSVLACQSMSFIDNSSNNFAITVLGNTAIKAFNPFNSNFEMSPRTFSTYFDGTGDYLSVVASTNLTPAAGDFTVEFWFYNTHTTWSRSMDFIDAGSGGFCVYINSTGNLYVTRQSTSGASKLLGTLNTTVAPLKTWNHFAIVRSSGSSAVYINGVRLATPVADTNSYGSFTKIGGTVDGYIIGYLSNLRFVKGTALYTTNFTPSTTALEPVAGTKLLTCQTAFNESNAFEYITTVTASGNAAPRPVTPFI